MLYQKLKNLYKLFSTGKKSIYIPDSRDNNFAKTNNPQEGKVQIIYHRGLNLQGDNMKAEEMQHDWWIN